MVDPEWEEGRGVRIKEKTEKKTESWMEERERERGKEKIAFFRVGRDDYSNLTGTAATRSETGGKPGTGGFTLLQCLLQCPILQTTATATLLLLSCHSPATLSTPIETAVLSSMMAIVATLLYPPYSTPVHMVIQIGDPN